MDGRQLKSHTISSPWAYGSGELKTGGGSTKPPEPPLDPPLMHKKPLLNPHADVSKV